MRKILVVTATYFVFMVGCQPFKAPKNATKEQIKIFDEANKTFPDVLAQVRRYYLSSMPESSCKPYEDKKIDEAIVSKFLNNSNSKLELIDYNQWFLNVAYYNADKSEVFSLEVKLDDGKCIGFDLEQGFICED